MSEQVQSIIEAVRSLNAEQRQELAAALADIDGANAPTVNTPQQLVASIRGKYRHIPTSVESFLDRKREDTARETRS